MASELHQRIRAARESSGLKREELAKRCGRTLSAVSMWESANGNCPSLTQLEAIAKATGVSLFWLVDNQADVPINGESVHVGNQRVNPSDPAWAGLSTKHLRLARALENAEVANAFPPDVAGAMADILESFSGLKIINPTRKK